MKSSTKLPTMSVDTMWLLELNAQEKYSLAMKKSSLVPTMVRSDVGISSLLCVIIHSSNEVSTDVTSKNHVSSYVHYGTTSSFFKLIFQALVAIVQICITYSTYLILYPVVLSTSTRYGGYRRWFKHQPTCTYVLRIDVLVRKYVL